MKLLLHICCGPCASGAVPWWQGAVNEVTGYFYNPNIHPLLEYRRRLTGARDVAEMTGLPLLVDDSYDPAEWFATVAPGEGSRCARCIGQRLEATAARARAEGCDAFATSLSISPWQDHEAIRERGAVAGARHGVQFMYEDLRALYPRTKERSRAWGIYRQKYCGCLLSEWERYRGTPQGPGGRS